MKTPFDTAREARENPMSVLLEAMAFGPGAIEMQETRGQHSFVNSDTLPTDVTDKDKAIFEAAGVKFLGAVEGDPLFQYVELPAGWKKVPTSHSVWSNLVDEKGRERAAIFYKAAFYDRKAHAGLTPRYSYALDYDRADKDSVAVAHVKDCGTVIHSTDPKPTGERYSEEYRYATGLAETEARNWLDVNYPEWRNAGAYWD